MGSFFGQDALELAMLKEAMHQIPNSEWSKARGLECGVHIVMESWEPGESVSSSPEQVEGDKRKTEPSCQAEHIEKMQQDFWCPLNHHQNDSQETTKKPENPQGRRTPVKRGRTNETQGQRFESWRAEEQVVPDFTL